MDRNKIQNKSLDPQDPEEDKVINTERIKNMTWGDDNGEWERMGENLQSRNRELRSESEEERVLNKIIEYQRKIIEHERNINNLKEGLRNGGRGYNDQRR